MCFQGRGGFDFTLLFEDAILSIAPIALILCIAPLRIAYLWRRNRKVSTSLLLPAKLVSDDLDPLSITYCN